MMSFVLRVSEPEFRVEELGDSSVSQYWYGPRDDWSKAQPILPAT
ncbi:MAG: hypothetical protein OEM77_00995 [Nitrosopumilus sp.]|nr:hypothetical protein [Nitrosopumilus sp.]MDH3735631.1 hypothetical protein [Nitrosopumilus sp.]MDH3822583.1 hypothetical protein [Nitrosopumilus sp.]MDH3833247.1 hypothetical protein [Nitrosopumilus sp.]